MFLKFIRILVIFESQVIAQDVQPGFVTVVFYVDIRMVNVTLRMSVLRILFTSVDVLFTSV